MKLFTLFLLTAIPFLSFSQYDVLERFENANAVNNRYEDIVVQDTANVWLASTVGLHHFDGQNFTLYDTSNSNLNSNIILELELVNNTIWLRTNLGVSSFDGTTFTNYDSSAGFVANSVTSLSSTSNGVLWIGTFFGIFNHDGQRINNISNRVTIDVETDTNNNVYFLHLPFFTDDSIVQLQIFDGTNWFTPQVNSPSRKLINPEFKRLSNGGLYLVDRLEVIEVQYPFNLIPHIFDQGIYNNPGFRDIDRIDDRWWLTSHLLGITEDSIVKFNQLYLSPELITTYKSKVLITSGADIILISKKLEIKDWYYNLDINTIRATTNTIDPLFNTDRSASAFEFPKDSASYTIYLSDFIIAATNRDSTIVFPKIPYIRNYEVGPLNSTSGLLNPFAAKVSRSEIDSHKLNYQNSAYQIPKGILEWPALGDSTLGISSNLAPYFDSNNNGCYDPQNGDYPIIKGDQAVYWINHPNNPDLKFEYHWMMYAFNNPTNPDFNQNIFLDLRMINRDTLNYDTVRVGYYIDFDLGNPADDFIGSDSLNSIMYAYNGDAFDENFNASNGYKTNIPSVGVKFLSDSLTSAIYYNSGGGPLGDPNGKTAWINYLQGKLQNGQSIYYGGGGTVGSGSSTIPTKFMLTGNPYLRTGWTELTPGVNLPPNQPGDRRMFGGLQPFRLNSNQERTITLSIGVGQLPNPTDYLENIGEMKRILNHSKAVWDTITTPSISYGQNFNCNIVGLDEQNEEVESNLLIYPNPANNSITVKSDFKLTEITLYDLQGRLLMKIDLNAAEGKIDLSNLPDGVYLLNTVDTEGRIKNNKLILSR